MKQLLFVLAFGLMACQTKDVENFNGEQAMVYLTEQCDIGYRYPGSPGHETAKNYYINFLQNKVDTLIIQEFDQEIPRDSVTFTLTNIVAGFALEKGDPLLVGAHWDTRPRAEYDPDPEKRDLPIIGANDGASGIAILMHLADIFQKIELNRTVYLVFFDGEDYGYHDTTEFFCLGSKYFAKNLPVKTIKEGIIVDMVGDKNLELPIERYSYRQHKALVKELWTIAKARGYDAYQQNLGYAVYDDHVPLTEIANIPTVDIIDFTYPDRFTNYWHTHQDTPDKCSPKSLKQVGQVVLDYIMKEKK